MQLYAFARQLTKPSMAPRFPVLRIVKLAAFTVSILAPKHGRAQVDSARQIGPILTSSSRIRVTSTTLSPNRQIVRLKEISNDTLFAISVDGQLSRISRHDIQSLQISTGSKRRWKSGAKWGGIIGLATGVITGTAVGSLRIFEEPKKGDRLAAATILGLVFMCEGVILGGGIGSLFKEDRWVTVPPDRY